jgi:hypothetical protein
MNDCTYCQHSYVAGDEILCMRLKESETCESYELDEYFKENEGEKNES